MDRASKFAMFVIAIGVIAIVGSVLSITVKAQAWEECRQKHSVVYCWMAIL